VNCEVANSSIATKPIAIVSQSKMATLFSSSSLQSIRFSSTLPSSASASSSHPLPFCTFPCHPRISPFKALSIKKNRSLFVAKAVEDETQQEQVVTEIEQQPSSTSEQQPVVVPISPSDTLTMLFQVQHH
jgi:hypothetical protein